MTGTAVNYMLLGRSTMEQQKEVVLCNKVNQTKKNINIINWLKTINEVTQ